MSSTVRLFSYGTLQSPAVQKAQFERKVQSAPDRLPGYKLDEIIIRDKAVVDLSGAARHPIIYETNISTDVVNGVVLTLSPEELAAADAYETEDYKRVNVRLESGMDAFAFVAAVWPRPD
ncbi:MAG: gamma-glutamylcyclotransferase family protein [Pseudomonadota bacterium]